jgi:hypothetical protein
MPPAARLNPLSWLRLLPARRALWLPVALAFLFVNLTRIDDGGGNAMARFGVMRAMVDDHSFRIDRYLDWTGDWVKTPDGHYYSNKAPGPTLIAFPVFWIIDNLLYGYQAKHPDELGRRQAPRGIHKVAITTLFQVLPFLVFTLLCLNAAYPAGLTAEAYLISLLAILFGNTAGAMINSYMGNPFAGMAMLGFAYFYLVGRLGWASFLFGWLVMADYTEGALVLPFVALMLPEIREKGFWPVARAVGLGAFIPGALWCWYHSACFGGPLNLAFKYESNPAVVAAVQEQTGALWGIISFLPNPEWMYELLLGPTRGVLFTQPWCLLCMGLPFFYRLRGSRLRRFFYFAVASFVILWWINGGFPSWSGGSCPGPRYLAAVLPAFGLFLPLVLERAGKFLRVSLWALVAACVVLRGFMYATWILAGSGPIWPYYWRAMVGPTEWIKFSLYSLVLAVAVFFYRRRVRSLKETI